MNRLMLLLLPLLLAAPLAAQQDDRPDFPFSNRFSLVSGTTQLLLGGANIEATWYTRRLSFDYSHGFSLEFQGSALTPDQQNQRLAYRIPWTTGFGVGYRVLPFLDIRLEPKLHRYDLFHDDQSFDSQPLISYTTATLGLGLYYRYYPFRKLTNALEGIVIVPSARYWPNVWSSLGREGFSYNNRLTGQPEVHEAARQGIPGTGGFFVNVSIGYTFGGE